MRNGGGNRYGSRDATADMIGFPTTGPRTKSSRIGNLLSFERRECLKRKHKLGFSSLGAFMQYAWIGMRTSQTSVKFILVC